MGFCELESGFEPETIHQSSSTRWLSVYPISRLLLWHNSVSPSLTSKLFLYRSSFGLLLLVFILNVLDDDNDDDDDVVGLPPFVSALSWEREMKEKRNFFSFLLLPKGWKFIRRLYGGFVRQNLLLCFLSLSLTHTCAKIKTLFLPNLFVLFDEIDSQRLLPSTNVWPLN